MALRIVDEPLPTLADLAEDRPQTFQEAYPGDYSGTAQGLPPAPDYSYLQLYNSPMMQRERAQMDAARPKRYEEIVPFTGNNFIGNLFDPDGSDIRQSYEMRKQQYNARLDEQALRQTQLEANLWKAVETAPPGKRDPQLKLIERYYKSKGQQVDPEVLKFYKQADANALAASKWAIGEIRKARPDLDQNDLFTALNSDPLTQIEWYNRMAEFEQLQLKNEQTRLENKLYSDTGAALSQPSTEAPSSPQEPSQPAPISPQQSTTQRAPQTNLGATQRSVSDQGYWTWENTVKEIRAEAQRQGVDPDLAVAVAVQESGLSPNSEGDGGRAVGYFQLHPPAAQDVGLTPEQRYDPRLNIRGGVAYLKHKLAQSGGNVDQALVRYNGGGDPNYVQNVRRHLAGLPKPHSEAVAQAPDQVRDAVRFYDQKIDALQRTIERIPPMAAAHPRLKGMIDHLQKERDALIKRQEGIEKRYEAKPSEERRSAAEKLFPGTPWNMLTPDQRQAAEYFADQEKVRMSGETAEAEAKARAPYNERAAKAGNPAGIMTAGDAQKYYNTTDEGPVHPPSASYDQIEKENAEHRAKTGKDKWAVLSPPTVDEKKQANASMASIKATERIITMLDDPQVARLVGTLMSNPEGRFETLAQQVFGGVTPEKYQKIAAEISNLTSSILNARIGSAQTAAEFQRLAPMIGSMQSVDAPTLRIQMETLRNVLAEAFNIDVETMEGSGTAVPRNWKKIERVEGKPGNETKPPDIKPPSEAPTPTKKKKSALAP